MDHAGHRRQRGQHLGDLRLARDRLGTVLVAVDDHQHPRLDLPEPVDDRLGAELRGHRAEHRPQRGGREQQDQRLADVGRVRRHAVAPLDPERHQPGPDACDVEAQLGGGPGALLARLGPRDDHDVVLGATGQREHRLGVVGGDLGEPHGPRQPLVGQRHRRLGRGRQPQLAPDLEPEGVEVLQAPPAQRLVVTPEVDAVVGLQPQREAAQPGVLPRGGLPQHGRHGLGRGRRDGPRCVLAHRTTLERGVDTGSARLSTYRG